MSEVLVLSPVSSKQASLHLTVSSTKQVVNCLVVCIEHVSRTWGKEVRGTDIGSVFRHVPNQMTLATKKRSHPFLPHLVILSIKVRRTQTPILVRHLWILDWLESQRSVTGSDTN